MPISEEFSVGDRVESAHQEGAFGTIREVKEFFVNWDDGKYSNEPHLPCDLKHTAKGGPCNG